MAYSDLNYTSPAQFKTAFGLTAGQFRERVVSGGLTLMTRYKKPLITMDSIGATMYPETSALVLKRWGYDYEDVREKYEKMAQTLSGFPRCFFVNDREVPAGYYRVFYNRACLKVCVFVMDDFVRCVCFSRGKDEHLETVYGEFVKGNIEIEG